MKRCGVLLAGVAVVMLAVPGGAHADDAACVARFKELLVEGNPGDGPTRNHVTQTYAGNTTENYFHSMGSNTGEGVMQPLKNMGPMWVMFRDRKMYTSMDEGKSWKFGRELDAVSDPAVTRVKLAEDAKTASGIACSEEEFNGATHQTVQGEYVSSLLNGGTVFHKYWVNTETGWISKTETRSTVAGNESLAIQVLEPAPEFEFPKVD